MKKRLFTLLLTLCMALTLVPAAVAAKPLLISPNPNAAPAWLVPQVKESTEFPDVTGTWCESYVDTVYRSGLMTGKTAAKFDATSSLTHAQITVITARLHDLLNGGDGVLPAAEEGQFWYQSAVEHLRANCEDESLLYVLKQLDRGGDYPNAACVRSTFVKMLSAVLPELEAINEVDSVPDIDYNEEDYLPFYRAGILNGSDAYGTFNGSSPLTRGAAAAMLARIVDPAQRLTFTLKPFDLCRDVLGVEPDTALLTIEGTPIPAELFAYQLCVSLQQWEGYGKGALEDAIKFWCHYQGAFRVLAAELGITLSEEKQAELLREAEITAGSEGLGAAYWYFRREGSSLNLMMSDLYYEKDWKWGVGEYHVDLENRAEAMIQNAAPTEVLTSMDLSAVYSRLKNSPFIGWRS